MTKKCTHLIRKIFKYPNEPNKDVGVEVEKKYKSLAKNFMTLSYKTNVEYSSNALQIAN